MKTIEYRTVDKSSWGQGPWTDEPDKRQWSDPTTGYPCLIRRSPAGGVWCGYVGVSTTHPYYEKHYSDVEDTLEVHGGVTFSDHCQVGEPEESGVCHVTDGDDKVFWFGFDCGHAYDYVPGRRSSFDNMVIGLYEMFGEENSYGVPDDVYRDVEYVTSEVKSLAHQLKALE